MKQHDSGEDCTGGSLNVCVLHRNKSNQFKEGALVWHVARMRDDTKYTLLRNREGKKPLGILKLRVKDNIKMERKEVRTTFVDQILLVQDISGGLLI
jgi:hypothetical protein